ncbi:hypothetical protein B6G06_08985 [Actinomyces gaoshouyii]|nr:hypothetical protein B6G06_08985 [Actinomyces gaoshouyii]
MNAIRATVSADAVGSGHGRAATEVLSAHYWCMRDLLATTTAALLDLLQALARSTQGWVLQHPVYTVGIAVGLYMVASAGRRR